MPVPSQPAAIAPESATTALYRAALGTVNVGRYLPVFVRFDEAGRAGPSWNWAAALLTLNWLVFRQLWVVALLYVAAVEGLVLLAFGLGREWLATPTLAEWGFLGAIFVLSCLIPGVYGNAWLHADARRRMTRAVREARTVREACATLTQRASTRQRLVGLVIINVLLAAAALGAYWGLSRWMADQQAPTARAVPPLAAPAETVQATEKPEEPEEPEKAVEPEVLEVTQPAPPAPTAGTVVEAALAQPLTAQATEVANVEPASALPPEPLPTPASPPSGPASLQGFAINVGLFADAANADRVHSRLLDAGLPAYIQVVDFPNGQRTRVRVGPFASRVVADEAALRIRTLGLEALVFRQ